MSIRRGTCLCFAAVCLFVQLARNEVEAKGGRGSGMAKSAALVGHRHYSGGYYNSGSLSRGTVDESLPLWKLLLIILAVCLMLFGILMLCHCMRSQQEPDEREAKRVAEFLERQEAQRRSSLPVQPQQLPCLVNGDKHHNGVADGGVSSTTTLLPPDTAAGGARAPPAISFNVTRPTNGRSMSLEV